MVLTTPEAMPELTRTVKADRGTDLTRKRQQVSSILLRSGGTSHRRGRQGYRTVLMKGPDLPTGIRLQYGLHELCAVVWDKAVAVDHDPEILGGSSS